MNANLNEFWKCIIPSIEFVPRADGDGTPVRATQAQHHPVIPEMLWCGLRIPISKPEQLFLNLSKYGIIATACTRLSIIKPRFKPRKI